MRRFLRILAILGLVVLATGGALLGWLSLTAVNAASLPPLRTGDIVFQNTTDDQALAIMLASGSVYTHAGLIEIATDGRPMVVEAIGPVRTVSLDQWIGQGTGGRITVKRLPSLSPTEAEAVIGQAHRYDGRPYDIFFLPDEERIYCSELVRLAFEKGLNIALGKMQKVRELDVDNSAARALIESRWQRHPLCQDEAADFETCYARIMEQQLVTPVSIAEDPKLEAVYSNFGILASE
jgi:hypothetical protein